jgi:phosphoserine phosphatase
LAKAAGVGDRVSEITERAMAGELDFRASFKERLALLKGLDVGVLDSIGASLRLTEGAETLFAELKRLGYKTAILSGGFTYFAKQLQAKLGIDYVFANELEVVDGKVTGVAIEPIVDAQRKADLLKELAHKEGLRLEQTIAVGDGANDLPMLAIAGLGVAFRAKPLVKQSAKQAISTLGLDGVLYLLGLRDRDGQLLHYSDQRMAQAFGRPIPWPICTATPAIMSSAHFTWSGPNSTTAVEPNLKRPSSAPFSR